MHSVRHALQFITVLLAAMLFPGQIPLSDAKDGIRPELLSGQDLSNFCIGKYDTDIGVCSGYIMAIAETMTGGGTIFGKRACGHDGIKAQQLVDLVRMDIAEDPSLRKLPGGMMVASVMAREFPCLDRTLVDADRIAVESLTEPAAGQ